MFFEKIDKKINLYLIASLCVGIVISIFSSRYFASDNVQLWKDLRHGFPVHFMSTILGSLMQFLYQITGDLIPWFGLFLIVSIIISIASLLLLFKDFRISLLFLLAVIFVLHLINFVQLIGYNSVSILLGGVALILFFYESKKSKIETKTIIFAGLMFAVCYLWRKQTPLYLALVFAPLLLITLFQLKNKFKNFIVFLLPLLLSICLEAGAAKIRTSPELEKFREYNFVRGQIHGTSSIVRLIKDHKRDLLKHVDWSEEDYTLFNTWLFYDENVYSQEKLTKFKDFMSDVLFNDLKTKQFAQFVDELYQELYDLYEEYEHLILPAALISFLLFFYCPLKYAVFNLVLFTYIILMGTLLAYIVRFPDRIAEPAFGILICFSLSLIFLLYRPLIKIKTLSYLLLIAGLAYAAKFPLTTAFDRERVLTERRAMLYEQLDYFERFSDDTYFVLIPGSISHQYLHPLSEIKMPNLITSGWPIFSPYFYHYSRKVGVEKASDLFPKASTNPKIVFGLRKKIVQDIENFIFNHYGIKSKFLQVGKIKNVNIPLYVLKKLDDDLLSKLHYQKLNLLEQDSNPISTYQHLGFYQKQVDESKSITRFQSKLDLPSSSSKFETVLIADQEEILAYAQVAKNLDGSFFLDTDIPEPYSKENFNLIQLFHLEQAEQGKINQILSKDKEWRIEKEQNKTNIVNLSDEAVKTISEKKIGKLFSVATAPDNFLIFSASISASHSEKVEGLAAFCDDKSFFISKFAKDNPRIREIKNYKLSSLLGTEDYLFEFFVPSHILPNQENCEAQVLAYTSDQAFLLDQRVDLDLNQDDSRFKLKNISYDDHRYKLVTNDGKLVRIEDDIGQKYEFKDKIIASWVTQGPAFLDKIKLNGWAVDAGQKSSVERVLVFVDDRFVLSAPTIILRNDVASLLGEDAYHRSGFQLHINAKKLRKNKKIRMFGITSNSYAGQLKLQ